MKLAIALLVIGVFTPAIAPPKTPPPSAQASYSPSMPFPRSCDPVYLPCGPQKK